ncbi:TetR/AcrR family transcriptional regulator [Amnibacterium kyonggiense]|uniref:DNA-binding transcriptional regulator YbjK n=1 Tax=Amnibacterium kyonggiense TaxID=595671 RepID=A0A4R7FTN2_9MICO|nr:TetR family transcriptional regulator [Amnibacterium kyonggiense]TDS81079.1 DNA-binding transcriptional regulator YbjK [Amnibacterium kyonggiense]
MPTQERLDAIADAAVAVVASGGARALTHRAVDARAGLPIGSTSFSVRTRHDLLRLTLRRITATTQAGLDSISVPDRLSVDQALHLAETVLEHLATTPAPHRARMALLLELEDEDRAELTDRAPVRRQLLAAARQLLVALGSPDPAARSVDLVGLIDALVLYRSLDIAPVDSTTVLRAFLRDSARVPS